MENNLKYFDYDEIDEWFPYLCEALIPILPDKTLPIISNSSIEYMEDSLDLLFKLANKDQIINSALDCLSSSNIIGYHGTRLTQSEKQDVIHNGLIPLVASNRISRISEILSEPLHSKRISIEELNSAIVQYGGNKYVGSRENQVHLTLSYSGLINGFNHYITYGSEFDQHVVRHLWGDKGLAILAKYGDPFVAKVCLPGVAALNAAHPYFPIEDLRQRGEIPNIVHDFLIAWSCRIAIPNFQTKQSKLDTGMMFTKAIPPEWILKLKCPLLWNGQSNPKN